MIEELQRRPRILAIRDEWDEERLQERIREAVRRVSGVGVGSDSGEGVRRVLGHPEAVENKCTGTIAFLGKLP